MRYQPRVLLCFGTQLVVITHVHDIHQQYMDTSPFQMKRVILHSQREVNASCGAGLRPPPHGDKELQP